MKTVKMLTAVFAAMALSFGVQAAESVLVKEDIGVEVPVASDVEASGRVVWCCE